MKLRTRTIEFLNFFNVPTDPFAVQEEPIRYEIFSTERLEQHAASLAAKQKVTEHPRKGLRLTPRIHENGRVLLAAYHAVVESVREQRAITPAAEWLLDNFHIVDEQLRDIRDHLPSGYYRELPKLSGGPLKDYPRVYELTWSFVAHTDSRFAPEILTRFIHAYQQVQPLTIGELWAVPTTLRIVLIENLRRIAVRIIGAQKSRLEADRIADELLGMGEPSLQPAMGSLEGMIDDRAFTVQLIQRLRSQGAGFADAVHWLRERLEAQGTTPDEVVFAEHSRQASANVTVRNIITSMRLISTYSWNNFFEEVSLVDRILRTDSLFAEMDFITRDRYRHGLEELAKGSPCDELEVARRAIAKAEHARLHVGVSEDTADWRTMDPGYYLISKGRSAFEKEIGFRPTMRKRILRTYIGHATSAYLGSIVLATLLLVSVPVSAGFNAGVQPLWIWILTLLAFFPASDMAILLINRIMTGEIGPRHLPRLELASGIPDSLRTFVAVPTFLADTAEIEEQIGLLEVHYLANPDGAVHFALLTDWPDADAEILPGDMELLGHATRLIKELNLRHGMTPDDENRFYLFHRKRLWNERERKWMGWERKRGKLHEFNRLLQGNGATSFITMDGLPPQVPPNCRYVITLDADTRLPVKTVSELVGSMAHPLNLPRFDERQGRVIEGYGVLQPRIIPSFPARHERSLYHHLFAGPCGVDPYAFSISDIYQDLFGEGSYTGKGIYDVEAFEAALKDRVPENAILSHDLFEGTFARCGLASDIMLFEEFPSHALVAAARQHRWVRGDWQLLPWIFGKKGKDIPLIGHWKMIDNMRRSLSSPGMLSLLVASWLVPDAPCAILALFVLANLGFPAFLSVVSGLIPSRRGISWRNHLRAVSGDIFVGIGHTGVVLTLLAYQAWLMLDAIGRTLLRLFITRRNLLEWVTAAHAKRSSSCSLNFFFRRMIGAELLVGGALLLTALLDPGALPVAVPFLLLWCVSPVVARQISIPAVTKAAENLVPEDMAHLRRAARRVWRFFTTFVTSEDHWLPPDNFQEDPSPVIAHRSSPTNFGLYLLSIVAARDFGWIGLTGTVERIEETLATLHELPRFRGHFYNWYETRELRALDPKYISSVDSGNLAGHLLTLSQACNEMKDSPILLPAALEGVADTLSLLVEALQRAERVIPPQYWKGSIAEIAALLETPPTGFAKYGAFWNKLENLVEIFISEISAFLVDGREMGRDDAITWAENLLDDIRTHRHDLDILLPWVKLLENSGRAAGRQMVMPHSFLDMFRPDVSLSDMAALCDTAIKRLRQLQADTGMQELQTQFGALADSFERSREMCSALAARLERIGDLSLQLFDDMDFSFLYDRSCRLFSIGYRVGDESLDPSFYDLLASEARLASFIAVAKGDVPPSHWYRLGRVLVPVGKGAALVSWSGSMFEYLMPSLIMYTPHDTLLDRTCRLVIARQIEYGKDNGVPWGVSESAFNIRDLSLSYQYSAFGVPGLGLKRGLGQDLVIAPYATALAAMYDPIAAARNFRRLDEAGGRGPEGFYEALDFTRSRLPEGSRAAVIRAYMAHHQGMSLVALDNVIHNGIMRHRFHREPMINAAEPLLQERMPRDVGVARPLADQIRATKVWEAPQPVLRRFHSAHQRFPATHLLSNGRYAVMVTAAGSGYSRWNNIAVTRWREDVSRDPWGSYIFLRDTQSGAVWSATHQPTGLEAKRYEVVFTEDRARIVRSDAGMTSTLEIILSPEDDVELRQLAIVNESSHSREIEVTSYAEIVLATQNADIAHPVFSNLFIHTEYHAEANGLLAERRPRSADDAPVWAAHVVAVQGKSIGGIEYESDRMRFLGRGCTIRRPCCVMEGRPLSNTVGNVLDPIFSLRVKVLVPPGSTAHVTFATMVASSRNQIVLLADKYHELSSFERTSTHTWTHAQILLNYLGMERGEAHLFQHIANRLLYSDTSMRPPPEFLKLSCLNVTALWRYGISGDNPILLVRIDDFDDRNIVRQLLRAHEYWRMKLLTVDLVILNEKETSYIQDLQQSLEEMVNFNLSVGRALPESSGRIFILRADLISEEECCLLQTAARAVLSAREGSLTEQIMRMRRQEQRTISPGQRQFPRHPSEAPPLDVPPLDYFNSLGGFTQDGREYVIVLAAGQRTPAPWINVIANESFGFQVSESGAGYTWNLNSRENQLTPWSNDPVCDFPGEALYLKDLGTGQIWSPTALPIRVENASYIARHGQGYSRFEHLSHGVWSELVQFAALNAPVKCSLLALENRSQQHRTLSVTAYVEWVLGFTRTITAPYIVTDMDQESGALFASNPWNPEFGGQVAFIDLGGRQSAWSADRIEFIGRNGTLEQPAGLVRGDGLSGKTGAGLDPCGVLQTAFELAPGERTELVMILGQARDREAARELILKYRTIDSRQELAAVREQWERILGKTQVTTPDKAMDIMLNSWLLYQTLVCRFRARAAFYQAGGAYGFRDQLQDCMALVTAEPALAREHIIRAAGRQFPEGDVQHWWHPPTGRGVRTHFSDDLVWLPYTVANYLEVTGDAGVLDEEAFFLEGEEIPAGREDSYFEPVVSEESATVYEHCARALDLRLATGGHGLPLMGSGDWNDGMNRVGHEGRGESVWLAWFLHAAFSGFAPLAAERGDSERAERWRAHMLKLKGALEKEAWDGAWYRRAYYDDGTPLGSASASECRIDSIAQSWGIISGVADPERARRAMKSLDEYLVRPGDDLVLLFTPPFDKTPRDPGYIKGYPPGIRENGGQYTHAAAWSVIAFAMMGYGDKAHSLFSMINPITHASTPAGLYRYRLEPYVAAADVYSEPPHTGRGGWSWYTGSSGWVYRAGIEWILGIARRGETLRLDPCIPCDWQAFTVTYKHGASRYLINVQNPSRVTRGVVRIELDGEALPAADRTVPLRDDGTEHVINVVMG